ncbi:MAG TPA: OmpH family outer membrane protein [Anaeromyxobacter sp.]|nr:OmpH family outer membrane protein [Anaeromyxobacter sp.]
MRHPLLPSLLLALALAPVAARAQQKIGYVDLQRALNEVEEGKAAKAVLQKDFAEKQKQLDARKTEFEKLQSDFEKQAVVMSEQARKDKAQDIDRRARELQALFVNLQKDLSEREREATRGIFDRMNAIVQDIAEADGFTYVLEKGAGIVYAPASLDLTNELIRKYNAKYPGGGARKTEAAAPKKGDAPAPKKADAPAAKK